MAIILRLDGVDDRLSSSLPKPLGDSFWFESKISTTTQLRSGVLVATRTGGLDKARFLVYNYTPGDGGNHPGRIGVGPHHGLSLGGYADAGSALYDGEPHIIRVEYTPTLVQVWFDGNLLSFVSTTTGTLTATTADNISIGDEVGTKPFAGDIYYIKGNLDSSAPDFNYDANLSVHTAGTPVLTDTISGSNATGVNMPTAALGQPGSAWIDLGGGGISIPVIMNQLRNQGIN